MIVTKGQDGLEDSAKISDGILGKLCRGECNQAMKALWLICFHIFPTSNLLSNISRNDQSLPIRIDNQVIEDLQLTFTDPYIIHLFD